ncbi:hypothetical protein JW721_03715 [Candidatus Micrarchaeota archaeon]|nr:hypothetical protein [Candidatus Micrarchaeota archaeon]
MKTMKGQAVMEYLMTYGWALVALILVIGALLATGAFNPSYLVSEECTLQPDLSCTGHVLSVDNDGDFVLKFRISNGLGYDIMPESLNVTTSDQEVYSLEASDFDLEDGVLGQGNTTVVEVELNNMVGSVGDTERITVSLEYISCAPEVNPGCIDDEPVHTISGRIVARVEKKD